MLLPDARRPLSRDAPVEANSFMIDFLEGTLSEKQATRVVVDCGGIGLEVHIPLTTSEQLPPAGERGRLLTVHHVREGSHLLYGFATGEERHLFRLLTSVSGVGPRIALAVLSHQPPAALTEAIRRGDAAILQRVPGVGGKIAARLVNELRNVDLLPAGLSTAVAGPRREMLRDAEAALTSLGFTAAEARHAVAAAAGANPTACTDIAALVRAAINA